MVQFLDSIIVYLLNFSLFYTFCVVKTIIFFYKFSIYLTFYEMIILFDVITVLIQLSIDLNL